MSTTAQLHALVLNADFRPLNCYPLSTWSFERTMRKVLSDRVVVDQSQRKHHASCVPSRVKMSRNTSSSSGVICWSGSSSGLRIA